MPDEIEENDDSKVSDAVQALMMHFDAVQVFVTRHDAQHGTLGFCNGAGNFYARVGLVQQWINGSIDEVEDLDELDDEEEA
jgi:hypothetical protein